MSRARIVANTINGHDRLVARTVPANAHRFCSAAPLAFRLFSQFERMSREPNVERKKVRNIASDDLRRLKAVETSAPLVPRENPPGRIERANCKIRQRRVLRFQLIGGSQLWRLACHLVSFRQPSYFIRPI